MANIIKAYRDARVILTGASSGIGRQIALQLGAAGARIALAARRADKLEEVAEEVEAAGGEALVCPTDVADRQACAHLIEETVRQWGGVDVLINNAGVRMYARFDDTENLDAAEHVMRVNYLGSVACTYFALPHLKLSQGRIIAVISLAGLAGVPTRSFYAASKHAQSGFFDSIRIELEGTGVSVTSVYPSYVSIEERGRALGGDGEILGEHAGVDETRAMTAAECASQTLQAGANRQRQRIMSPGNGRLAMMAKALVPQTIDVVARRTLKRYEADE